MMLRSLSWLQTQELTLANGQAGCWLMRALLAAGEAAGLLHAIARLADGQPNTSSGDPSCGALLQHLDL